MENLNNGSMVFALDIGTRSIVGLLGTIEDNRIIVHYSAMEFHRDRVMYDGQIHDIDGVSKIVKTVKDNLENQSGFRLDEVAVAAAGRSLKTCHVTIEKNIDLNREIDRHLINTLEIEGLQKAQNSIKDTEVNDKDYLCVGYTIKNYFLNDALITNPLGHRGEILRADIIATFLPQIVVDGLHSVMSKVGLEISFITLEPIAAIEVAVPQNVRLLNIALVDIGAGTSDIAITKDGTIIGYAMTSTAGDEITEAIAKGYLMDFDSAEVLKCNLNKEKIQNLTDILGFTREVESNEILDTVEESIELVGKEIADSILKQNGKPPSAVFLIGGGSQIPRLPEIISGHLGILKERVAVRGIETIQNLIHDSSTLIGPEGITPVGILVKAIKNRMTDFITIKVNKNQIKLFQSKKLKVSDALIIAGFNPRDLIPKKGQAITVYINGQKEIFYGEYGEPAKIYVNEQVSSLDTVIKDRDNINIIPAQPGKPPSQRLENVIKKEDGFILNGQYIDFVYNITLNGKGINEKQVLSDGDKIEYNKIRNVEELCDSREIDLNVYNIYINGKIVDKNTEINKNDRVVVINKDQKLELTKDSNDYSEHIIINCNGDHVKIPCVKDEIYFVDIFNFIDFDRSKVQGKLILRHNGRYANYTDKLEDGDYIEVYWEKAQ
ncbi:cell division protein FtsA [Serpentinicella alkaliphila]|uniref:Chaperone protein DnaK n=1 Tax=Serpentinicella alkaliphila TaxID=1734049 RepID=A0A4R2THE3_9FIRM|nr:cell division FtsA domain-containing protein [Serpentinicella alkaliphila]QUH25976.1 cell division protein FtsA [Serpentinicella alkaliphila]TCQ02166.1 cell division protein FtsA [Serpentinicella alkaliphila]